MKKVQQWTVGLGVMIVFVLLPGCVVAEPGNYLPPKKEPMCYGVMPKRR